MSTIEETDSNWILIRGNPPKENDITEVINHTNGVRQLIVKDTTTGKFREYEIQFPKDTYTKDEVKHFENYTSKLMKTLNKINENVKKTRGTK